MSIKEIQKKIGVTVDGKVGPDTTKKAWTAYFDNKLNDTDMAELNIDTDVPPPSEYVPEGLDANKYYQWVPPLKIGQKIEVKKPEDTEPMVQQQSVPKVEKEDEDDTDTVTFKPPKSGIMALLDPYDSPDYMGSRLYLKNERENYAKAIGNTPLTGKYWEDKDYSNDDVKDLLDSAMEDVKTQEAMKNAMEDRKSTTISNIRALANQSQDAAASIRSQVDVANQTNKIIDGEIDRDKAIISNPNSSSKEKDAARSDIEILKAKRTDTTNLMRKADEKEAEASQLATLMGVNFNSEVTAPSVPSSQPVVTNPQVVTQQQSTVDNTVSKPSTGKSKSKTQSTGLQSPTSGSTTSLNPDTQHYAAAQKESIDTNNSNILNNFSNTIASASNEKDLEELVKMWNQYSNSGIDMTKYQAAIEAKIEKVLAPAERKDFRKKHRGF